MTLGSNTLGFLLAIITAFFWGALPLAVKQLLPVIDATTLVWLRFCVAALWLWIISVNRHAPSPAPASLKTLPLKSIILLAVATLGLGLNFVFFNSSVAYLSASACQILAQAGPVLLLLGGVFVLKEPFLRIQAFGVIAVLLGLLLFFNTRLALLVGGSGGDFSIGVAFGCFAAFVWATYGVAQKILLREMSPTHIMRIIYLFCALGLTPFANPSSIWNVNAFQGICLLFACANTIIAYGAFTKAMTKWHAAKISGIVTTTPLFTLLLEACCHAALPDIFPAEHISLLSYIGTFVVVLGALCVAIGPVLHFPQHFQGKH